MDSHQIDYGEQPDPNDIERVPEQGKTEETALHAGNEPSDCYLSHHHHEPDQTEANVQPVAANKSEECRKKCTALGGRTLSDHGGEFTDLKTEKDRAERKSE